MYKSSETIQNKCNINSSSNNKNVRRIFKKKRSHILSPSTAFKLYIKPGVDFPFRWFEIYNVYDCCEYDGYINTHPIYLYSKHMFTDGDVLRTVHFKDFHIRCRCLKKLCSLLR